ncbi:MAG TPA: hypothetical protein VIH53_00130 [Gemmatimonadaceae bacterium]
MKRFAFRLVPTLGVLAFVLSCTDGVSPDPHSGLRSESPTPAIQGNLPPPPTRTVVEISVASQLLIGTFTGVYFANGRTVEAAAAAAELGDPILGWNGTAWLRLDNAQTIPQAFPVSNTANARFQITQGDPADPLGGNLSGKGTIVIAGHKITIDRVTSFIPNPQCVPGAVATPCAFITFDASVDGESGHHGTAQAFDRDVCDYVSVPDPDVGEGPGFQQVFVCPYGDNDVIP